MKKLFTAIHKGDLDTVQKLLDKDPALIACTAKKPPKNDDGQSPLQVALKSGQLEIAVFLLDRGADVNFIESPDCVNDWRMPVLQDAITCAIMCCRWNTVAPDSTVEVFSTQERADAAFAILERMISAADVTCKDSCGNGCHERAILSARQILPRWDRAAKCAMDDRKLTDELRHDLSRIFRLLIDAGVPTDNNDPNWGMPLAQVYKDEPVGEFLNPTAKQV